MIACIKIEWHGWNERCILASIKTEMPQSFLFKVSLKIMHSYQIRTFCPPVHFMLVAGTNKGDDDCYELANVRGDQFGNCGYNSSSFISCDPEYVTNNHSYIVV